METILNQNMKDLIIYCTGGQLDEIKEYLDELGISNNKITSEESVAERERILKLFAKGYYQALIGIKCLDEGVDVPSTQTAILMASTLNTRQHIQRRGRILRRSPGKKKANIIDLVVFPNLKNQPDYVKRIIKNEMKRYDEYADLAENFEECDELLFKRREKYL